MLGEFGILRGGWSGFLSVLCELEGVVMGWGTHVGCCEEIDASLGRLTLWPAAQHPVGCEIPVALLG